MAPPPGHLDTDIEHQAGITNAHPLATDFMQVDGAGKLATDGLMAQWNQIGSILDSTPAVQTFNRMPAAMQLIQENQMQTVHNYHVTIGADQRMAQMMEALAAQYHTELVESRNEEQHQYQLAIENGHYAHRYAMATAALGQKAIEELQERDYRHDELQMAHAQQVSSSQFGEQTAKAIHDEARTCVAENARHLEHAEGQMVQCKYELEVAGEYIHSESQIANQFAALR